LIRPSSKEFFDKLATYFPTREQLTKRSLSGLLEDEPWFFLSWMQDPTIQSALAMLDSIQKIFGDMTGLYEKLENTDKPIITFQLLELEQFGLSDDLYIKMNARGKPLTVFENFKARLERHLNTNFPKWKERTHGVLGPVKDYFSHCIESRWSDLFWQYRDAKSNLFDEQFMNLFRAFAIVTRAPDATDFISVVENLREDQSPLTFQRCLKLACLDKPMLETLFSYLDKLSGSEEGTKVYLTDVSYFDERELFKRAVYRKGGLTYEDLLLLHAYAGYLLRHDVIRAESIWDWMRVLRNLTRNTIYNRSEDFQRSLRSVNELLNQSGDILGYLAKTTDAIAGFNEQQVREEKIKAQLMLKCPEWRSPILTAEGHGYLAGQIEFLFKFAGVLDAWLPAMSADWDSASDDGFRRSFAMYYEKMNRIFDGNGLRSFNGFLWERALLSEGDYLVESGRGWSFLKSEGRETSWKRLLRGNPKKEADENTRLLVKQLLDKMDTGKEPSVCLQDVIEQANIEEAWRRFLVSDHRFIGYCENRLIRWQSESCVYLMHRTQMNGAHAELFSYNLYLHQILQMAQDGKLQPFDSWSYQFVSDTEKEPHILLRSKAFAQTPSVSISNLPSEEAFYKIELDWPFDNPAERTTFFAGDNGHWRGNGGALMFCKTVPHASVVDELCSITSRLLSLTRPTTTAG
jgi:hypothetical protein